MTTGTGRIPFRSAAITGVLLILCLLLLAQCRDGIREREAAPPAAEPRPQQPAEALSPETLDIVRLISDGRFDHARVRLQSRLARDSDDAHAWFLFGLSFHRELRYGQARGHFERAIELMPGYHPAHHFYGWCLYYLGELEKARTAFETHLSMVPSEADSHFAIGLIDLDEHDLDAAEQRFRAALALTGDDPARAADRSKAHARLGETLERRGDLEAARRELEVATTLYPDHYEALYMLYRVLIRLGDEEAADRALAEHEAAKQRVRPDPRSES